MSQSIMQWMKSKAMQPQNLTCPPPKTSVVSWISTWTLNSKHCSNISPYHGVLSRIWKTDTWCNCVLKYCIFISSDVRECLTPKCGGEAITANFSLYPTMITFYFNQWFQINRIGTAAVPGSYFMRSFSMSSCSRMFLDWAPASWCSAVYKRASQLMNFWVSAVICICRVCSSLRTASNSFLQQARVSQYFL